jgi:hypothetical protein
VSPGEAVRSGKRRLLAEEHIAYSLVLGLVILASTFYAVATKDHSANVWAVYVGVVSGVFGLMSNRGKAGSRQDDPPTQ